MSRRTLFRLSIVSLVIVLGLAGWLWFSSPFGTGEYRHSPDGRYTAHASNLSCGTIRGEREWYIEIRVVEELSGLDVWKIIQSHSSGAEVPDYGNRERKFIVWSADSGSVTVPVANGKELVLAVP